MQTNIFRRSNLLFLTVFLIFLTFIDSGVYAQKANVTPGWPTITKQMKPWTRWWWMGSAVDPTNLKSAMEAYSKAGLGGLEITPIYGVHGSESKFIKFLSPEWVDNLKYTLQEGKDLGMGIDLAMATGWPCRGI